MRSVMPGHNPVTEIKSDEEYALKVRFLKSARLFVFIPLGEIQTNQGGGKNSHIVRYAWIYSVIYCHYRWEERPRCQYS